MKTQLDKNGIQEDILTARMLTSEVLKSIRAQNMFFETILGYLEIMIQKSVNQPKSIPFNGIKVSHSQLPRLNHLCSLSSQSDHRMCFISPTP